MQKSVYSVLTLFKGRVEGGRKAYHIMHRLFGKGYISSRVASREGTGCLGVRMGGRHIFQLHRFLNFEFDTQSIYHIVKKSMQQNKFKTKDGHARMPGPPHWCLFCNWFLLGPSHTNQRLKIPVPNRRVSGFPVFLHAFIFTPTTHPLTPPLTCTTCPLLPSPIHNGVHRN